MKKKAKLSFIISIFIITILAGCDKTNKAERTEDDTVNIVSTIFPQYDWIREIVGESETIENSYLLDSGIDLHSFQPTASDINNILNSDLFIYVGGESDEWVEDVLELDTDNKVISINLMEVLQDNIKEEELVDGMEEEEHDHEDGEEDTEYDEHVWLSLLNTKIICEELVEVLCELDPSNSQAYKNNATNYIAQLDELNIEYSEMVDDAKKDTIVVADRFPFRYLVDDYSINYYAAFSGCSAETEASFETIITLAEKVNENELSTVIVTESSNKKIANTVIDNTSAKDQEVLVLNSLQSISKKEAEELSYIDVMRDNLEILGQALEEK